MVLSHLIVFVSYALLLQVLVFPDILLALRNGETGRYMYRDGVNNNMYCHYCNESDLSGDGLAQVTACFEKNFPFEKKTDKEEQIHKLRPICKRGKLPSCPTLHRSLNGEWKCTQNSYQMKSIYYNETVDGYILPVYTSCSLACTKGYHVVGTNLLYCNESRQWDTDTGRIHCDKDPTCPLLNRTVNGDWDCSFSRDKKDSKFYNETVSGYIVPVGTSCSLVCNDGYHVNGTNIIDCNESHQWNTETGVIHCIKTLGRSDAIVKNNVLVIIVSVLSVCAVICVAVGIFIYLYVCKGESYKTDEMTSSSKSDASSALCYFKEPTEHDEVNLNEGKVNEMKPLLEMSDDSDKTPDVNCLTNSVRHVEGEEISKGLHDDQTMFALTASCKGDKVDNTVNQSEGESDMNTVSWQVLSKGREPGDGLEDGDCRHEQSDDTLLKSTNINKGRPEKMNKNQNQLCDKGKKIDLVVKADMTGDTLGNLRLTRAQNTSVFKDSAGEEDVVNGSDIHQFRKEQEKGGQKECPVTAEGDNYTKVKVAYLSEEQGKKQTIVQEYNDNNFLVPLGKKFFLIPKCQGTISRFSLCKEEGHYRGFQYDSYQFLHMVESAKVEDHGSYTWEIFIDGCSSPKYKGRLSIQILDQNGFVSLQDGCLLSSPFWQSMNPESLLDDISLSLRDGPSGISCPPILDQTVSGSSAILHQHETRNATGATVEAHYFDVPASRTQDVSDPCLCTLTLEKAWINNKQKMEELIHRGENNFMRWAQLGSRVLHMEPWFLECLEWHLRGKVHDGPMKYILKQMLQEGKMIGHLVEHFTSVHSYDLVSCIKDFHSCDYCIDFYNLS